MIKHRNKPVLEYRNRKYKRTDITNSVQLSFVGNPVFNPILFNKEWEF